MAITKTGQDLVSPGVIDSHKGMNKAMRRGDSGVRKLLADDELIGSRYMKGMKHGLAGAGGGAGLGALLGAMKGGKSGAGLGALLGVAGGGYAGNVYGQDKADKEYLKKRGITPRMLGLKANFTEEASEKYLNKDKK